MLLESGGITEGDRDLAGEIGEGRLRARQPIVEHRQGTGADLLGETHDRVR